MKLATEIMINAPIEAVWNTFTDFNTYPEWNPFIKSITGQFEKDGQLQVVMPGMTFKPKVLTFQKNAKLVWLGHLWIKGIFDGRHSFELIPTEGGKTRFMQNESFSGLLVPLFSKKLRATEEMFKKMNIALKERVELTDHELD